MRRRIELAWQHRLPDGMHHEDGSSEGFTLSVSLPVGDDGLARCSARRHWSLVQSHPDPERVGWVE
jgi:hypothetical protein